MLAVAHRLRHPADYRRTVRQGLRATRTTLTVHHLPARASTPATRRPARVGFIVGRDVGNAVVRNAVTRRLRHIVFGRLGLLDDDSCTVVRARPAAALASRTQLESDLDSAFGTVMAAATTTPGNGSTS